MSGFTSLVIPGLMVAAAVLARRNVKMGRGDRKGAFRAAAVLFWVRVVAWLVGVRSVGVLASDISRLFATMSTALFDAVVLWITYLAVEPYIRKLSPDSLIGWTRLIGGRWRDPLVARDVLVGVSAGLAMTLVYASHNLFPPLFGRPEPMPLVIGDTTVLLGARFVLARMMTQFGTALLQGMLSVVGLVALMIPLKRKWATHLVGSFIYVWVVIQGMFNPGTPMLDFFVGLGIILVFTGVILYGGLLATIAALATHFMLLRAPITLDLSSWRAAPGTTYVVVIAAVGLAAAYFASARSTSSARKVLEPAA